MTLPEYILEHEEWYMRWKNRKDFLDKEEKIRHTAKNKTAIVCIFFNSASNMRILAEYISREEDHKAFDLIIINNSQNIKYDFAQELDTQNMIILSPITNLWTDWWLSLWLEYVIDRWYDYVFLAEDDVVFLDDQAFSSVYRKMDKKTLWFLSSVINYPQPNWHSCSYQFTCYPIDFLKKWWTIDPRFFTRWWEGEWEPRMGKTIHTYWYKKVIIDKRHFHPYLKKNNRSSRWIYFSRRNALRSTKSIKKLSATNILIFFMYIWSWYTKLFMKKSWNDLKALYLAVKDFLFAPKIIYLSLHRITQLRTSGTNTHKAEKELTIPIDTISDYTHGLYIMWKPSSSWVGISWFTNQDIKRLEWSSTVSAFFKQWIIIPNINSPVYPIALLSKKIVTIDELNVCNNTADISVFYNTGKLRIIKVIIALLLWIITFTLTMILVLIKTTAYKFFKK